MSQTPYTPPNKQRAAAKWAIARITTVNGVSSPINVGVHRYDTAAEALRALQLDITAMEPVVSGDAHVESTEYGFTVHSPNLGQTVYLTLARVPDPT